jgi:hypothetical protein
MENKKLNWTFVPCDEDKEMNLEHYTLGAIGHQDKDGDPIYLFDLYHDLEDDTWDVIPASASDVTFTGTREECEQYVHQILSTIYE